MILKKMELIVISNPVALPDECQAVNHMFRAGLQIFHLRKPNRGSIQMIQFLRSIDQEFVNRIVLHSHHKLAALYNVRGIHLNEATRLNPSLSEKILINCLKV